MRRAIIVAVVCVSCLAVGGWILRARSNGYRLPAIADIESIEVIQFSASIERGDAAKQGPKTFLIPVALNQKLMAALQPATQDNSPSKWVGLGELTIHKKDQTRIQVFLFDVSEGEGAFAVGESWEKRTYYRGGSSARLVDLLLTARKSAPVDGRPPDATRD